MKKIFILLVSNILFFSESISQFHKDTLKIEIDFKERNFLSDSNKLQKITIGQFYKVHISNINQNLFSISLNSIDTLLSTKQKTPVLGDINLSLPSIESPSSTPNENKYFHLQQPQKIINGFKKAIFKIQQQIEEDKFKIEKTYLSALSIESNNISSDVEIFMTKFNSHNNTLRVIYDDIVEKYNNYKDSTNTLNFNINANDQLKSYDEKIITAFEFLMKAVASLRDSISADKVSEYLQKMVVVNNNKGDYTSLPFQFSGEQTRLQINITPRDPAYKLQSYSTQIVFPTFPLKYNVTGISYYYSGLYDDAYTTLKPNDTTYQYSLIPSRNYEPGIAALLHSGSKFKGNCIGYHITFGIGANISEKVRPRLMVGFGASFGKKHMISIDGGLIVGNVNRLNAGVDFNKIYFEKQRPDPIISQEVSYKLFASIGYLFKF